MKILLIHNSHRSGSSSGDDVVFRKEAELLRKNGHDVIQYNPCNDEFDNGGPLKKLSTALQIPWSFSSARRVRELVRKEKPDIAHVHNFFPLISPSVYHALKADGVPVVQTLHDFRLLCVMAFFMRDGSICEECKEGKVFSSIRYGCFGDSRIQSIPVAIMLKLHWYLNTFKDKIDAYICLTESERKIFASAGFNENKLFVKPNFVENVSQKKEVKNGDYVVFIGRVGLEKGVKSLIEAWVALPEVPLKIVGDGPYTREGKKLADSIGIKNIEFSGYRPHGECIEILRGARFLVMPSICYETFGLTIIEAFSNSKPVIASRLGAMADIVKDGKTGLLFEPGNAEDMANKVKLLWKDCDNLERMGQNARREYEEKYTPEKNYEMMMNIYNKVMKIKR
ncbi:MAG: glycosyltransferase family 4 protein [Thermoplasmata archaeon]